MKKNEIIELLLTKGISREEISNSSLKELKIMLEEEQKGDDSLILLDQVKETEETIVDTPIPNKDVTKELNPIKEVDKTELILSNPPVPSDPGWTQYVMSLFIDDELEGQNPRLEGLRRVAEKLLGEVVEERCELISSPTMENGERACAKATIIFEGGRIFEALADACPGNCAKDFTIYPTAMADTRAKGRCYRAALRLKRIVSAEEICGSINEDVDTNKNIQTGQITTIRLLSDRSNISIKKLLDDLEIFCTVKDGVIDLKSLKYNEALIVLNRLNSMRQEDHVPEKLKR